MGGVVTQQVGLGRWTCDKQVVDSNPNRGKTT